MYPIIFVVGFVPDYRKIKVQQVVDFVDETWAMLETVKAIGKDDNFFGFQCEMLEDQEYILTRGPWLVDGALMMVSDCG